MFTRRYRSSYVFVIAFILLSGCAPPSPTQVPGIVETIVAATYSAAAAQTAAAMPSSPPILPTLAATKTPSPPTITPTPTPTFVVYLFSPTPTITLTPVPTETDDGGGGGAVTGPYVCQFISQSPDNGSTFSSKQDFDWKWKVRNVGTTDWYTDTMRFMYISGDRFALKDMYQLGNKTVVGETEQLTVHMKAPESPGIYTTTWAMRKGKYVFCYIQFQIVVK